MLHIIVNPASSSGLGARVWAKTEPQIRADGQPYEVHFSTSGRGIEQICAEITSQGIENTLLILGGDGTLNEAVNGIRDFERTRLGFLQVGSGNDLKRDMKLPRSRRKIIEAVLKGQVRRYCDIGEVLYANRSECLPGTEGEEFSRRLFNVSCGIGFDAECCHAAAVSRFKTLLNTLRIGKLIYIASAIRLIFGSQTAECEITFGSRAEEVPSGAGAAPDSPDGRETNVSRAAGTTLSFHNLLFAVCMNHQFQGGGFQFGPNASAEDGRLDLCTASDIRRIRFFRIFPTAYYGGHLRFNGVTEERSDAFTIRTDRPLWVHTDGEVCCKSSEITVRLYKEKLKLVL